MNWIKVIGIGIVVWGIGLIWPDINQVLTPELMTGMVLGLGLVVLGQMWLRRQFQEAPVEPGSPKSEGRPRTANDSRPVKPLGLA